MHDMFVSTWGSAPVPTASPSRPTARLPPRHLGITGKRRPSSKRRRCCSARTRGMATSSTSGPGIKFATSTLIGLVPAAHPARRGRQAEPPRPGGEAALGCLGALGAARPSARPELRPAWAAHPRSYVVGASSAWAGQATLVSTTSTLPGVGWTAAAPQAADPSGCQGWPAVATAPWLRCNAR